MVTSPRFGFSSAVLICSLALASTVIAQSKTPPPAPAKPTTQAPAAPAKWVAPVKGLVHIQIIKGDSKKVGNDVVTITKVKNISDGAIALLRLDELWYNKGREQVTGDTQTIRRPIMPGEVIEITTKSPYKPNLSQSQLMFTHANGKVDVKVVKAFK